MKFFTNAMTNECVCGDLFKYMNTLRELQKSIYFY